MRIALFIAWASAAWIVSLAAVEAHRAGWRPWHPLCALARLLHGGILWLLRVVAVAEPLPHETRARVLTQHERGTDARRIVA